MPVPRDDAKASAMYDLYLQNFSLADVGKAFGVTRQNVFKMFARRRFVLRETKPLPFIMWNGIKFTRRTNGYYASTTGDRCYLHRVVWEHHNGAIPVGWDVHHKDGDKTNNEAENLELIEESEHGKHHSKTNTGFKATQFKSGHIGRHYPRRR